MSIYINNVMNLEHLIYKLCTQIRLSALSRKALLEIRDRANGQV
jgi:hypothetical protein